MNTKGFTLVELVVVIIILGILSVTAIPKFVSLRSEAEASALAALKASLDTAAVLVYNKSVLQYKHKVKCQGTAPTCGAVDVNGTTIYTHLGYPVAAADEVAKMLDTQFGPGRDWIVRTHLAGYEEFSSVAIYLASDPGFAGCYVKYNTAQGYKRPATFIIC